eukprot:Pompholyxophrys_sp_v1_NODE_38_length_3314_cov_8.176434.p3 type:complete len:103 gc:universal NODE_38_length_3314_cov_8.176434:1634-1942(+)
METKGDSAIFAFKSFLRISLKHKAMSFAACLCWYKSELLVAGKATPCAFESAQIDGNFNNEISSFTKKYAFRNKFKYADSAFSTCLVAAFLKLSADLLVRAS